MKYKYDFHLHSDWSDGDYSVLEVFKLAKKAGLKGIAITDHDVMAPHAEIKEALKTTKMIFLEGIEISTNYYGIDIHVLGYFSKLNRKILERSLKETLMGREKRIIKMAKKLEKVLGIKINIEKMKKVRGKKPFCFKYNLEKAIHKLFGIPRQITSKLINRGGPASVLYGNWAMSPWRALRLIKKAGGICILAHPCSLARSNFSSTKTQKMVFELIKKLSQQGLDGIEVYYPAHTSEQIRMLKKLARKYNLLITGGSDWHGEIHQPEIKMGQGGLGKKEFDLFFEKINPVRNSSGVFRSLRK